MADLERHVVRMDLCIAVVRDWLGFIKRIPIRLPRALAHGAEIMFGVLVGILRLDLIAG
jgi:hypothetical protein